MMKFKRLAVSFLILSAMTIEAAHANEVKLTVNKPVQIVYQLAYQDKGSPTVLDAAKTIQIDDSAIIPVNLDQHAIAGLVIDSIDGHALPTSVNQFNKHHQCSIATNLTNTKGELRLSAYKKKIQCAVAGEMQDSAIG